MLSLLVALTLQPAAVSAKPVDADMRCMAAYLFAVGQMTDDPAANAEEKSAATSMVMYFFGKVRGRDPKADVKQAIKALVDRPNYLASELKPDLERCGTEYEQRGQELSAFGED